MKYLHFEELPVWQLAREFVNRVYQLTSKDSFKKDFDLIRQLRRAAVSIFLNISEGFERRTNKDFARFINQAKASAGECRAIHYIAKDQAYMPKDEFNSNIKVLNSLSKQLGALEIYLLRTVKK